MSGGQSTLTPINAYYAFVHAKAKERNYRGPIKPLLTSPSMDRAWRGLSPEEKAGWKQRAREIRHHEVYDIYTRSDKLVKKGPPPPSPNILALRKKAIHVLLDETEPPNADGIPKCLTSIKYALNRLELEALAKHCAKDPATFLAHPENIPRSRRAWWNMRAYYPQQNPQQTQAWWNTDWKELEKDPKFSNPGW